MTGGAIFFLLALVSALLGFGSTVFDSCPSINPAVFLPECLDGIIVGISRLMAVIFLLLFAVSLCFGKRLDL